MKSDSTRARTALSKTYRADDPQSLRKRGGWYPRRRRHRARRAGLRGLLENHLPMSTVTFRIVYDGPALAGHAMEVRDLAPALLALSEVLEEANAVLNGKRAQIRVKVHGSFKTGSFGVDLDVAQSFVSHVLEFLANDKKVVGSLDLLAILGFVATAGTSLLGLIKWLRGRPIKKVEVSDERGTAKVITEDGEIEVDMKVLELSRSYRLRRSLKHVIKLPLDREGVDTVAFVHEEQVTELVEKHERQAFVVPSAGEQDQLTDLQYETSLQLVSVPLREGYQWLVDDGSGPFTAEVVDREFVQRVQRGEVQFSAGDILVARVRRVQFVQAGELRSEHQVLRVVRHASAYQRIRMPVAP